MDTEQIRQSFITLLENGQYGFSKRASYECFILLHMNSRKCVEFIIKSLKNGVKLKHKISDKNDDHCGEEFWVFREQTEEGIEAVVELQFYMDNKKVKVFSTHQKGYNLHGGYIR